MDLSYFPFLVKGNAIYRRDNVNRLELGSKATSTQAMRPQNRHPITKDYAYHLQEGRKAAKPCDEQIWGGLSESAGWKVV